MSEPVQLTERSLQVLRVVTAWWRASEPGLRAEGLHEDKVAALLSASDKETGRVTEEIRGMLQGLHGQGLIDYEDAAQGEGKVCTPTEKACALTDGQP